MTKKSFATDSEIIHASKVLLPKGYCFLNDAEKVEIIKCNESKDIVACPGSGKTTTLLAKLLILANRMPLDKNKGICVLTHTNVAIDEIKDKLGSKADVLFRYPNHFGTIQSFVDKYLAIPYYSGVNKKKISSISNELYGHEIVTIFKYEIYKLRRNQLSKNIWSIVKNFSFNGDEDTFLSNLRIIGESENQEIAKNDGRILSFNKPKRRNQRHYTDWKEREKVELKEWFINLINIVHTKRGTLSYDDAYTYAENYIQTYPKTIKALSSRFHYVFIDEMQDTALHQIELLNKTFDFKKTIIQRFGDPFQSIYNKVSIEEIWKPRDFLSINTSCRFGETITPVLKTVCIGNNSDLKASGDIQSHQPIMIVYENPDEVLPKYCELLLNRNIDYYGEQLSVFEVSKRERRPIKAVGWVGKALDEKYPERFKLKSYFEDYHKEVKKKDKVDYTSLKSFLRKLEGAKVKDYKNKIIEAMLHILRIEGKTYAKNGRSYFYTKTTFLSALDEAEMLIKFNKSCSKWIGKLNETNSINENTVYKVKKHFIKKLFPVFGINSANPEVVSFLNNEISDEAFDEKTIELSNIYTYPENEEVKVEVSNIHQVKGETHTATLYMETWYQSNFESESIASQLIGKPYEQPKKKKDTYTKETLKMAYVGMSRPRYLLCMAVHKDRYGDTFDMTNGGLWEIVKTYN